MGRREFIRLGALSSLAWACPDAFAGTPGSRPPNIVFILADDCGYEVVGANGGRSYQTPNIDRLAHGGVRFTNCFSQPLCTPSRVQLLTGRYNFRNYVGFGVLPQSEVTLAHILRDAGYATAITGKWQLSGGADGPVAAGFQQYSCWHVDALKGSRYYNPRIYQNRARQVTTGSYGPDDFERFNLKFIADSARAEQPFFLFYNSVLPHTPWNPTPDLPDYQVSPRQKGPQYFAPMVRYLDAQVGRLVDAVEAAGQRDNTIFVFTGDNGCEPSVASVLDGQIVSGGKGLPIDAGIHVPLIFNWPARYRPRVSDALVDFSDFLPTFCHLSGTSPPADRTVDGVSFAPMLEGLFKSERDWIYSFYTPKHPPYRRKHIFARDHHFKLYANGNMYDVAADPLESSPLARGAGPGAHESRLRLQDGLNAMLAQFRDGDLLD